jgi:hypothetical protein
MPVAPGTRRPATAKQSALRRQRTFLLAGAGLAAAAAALAVGLSLRPGPAKPDAWRDIDRLLAAKADPSELIEPLAAATRTEVVDGPAELSVVGDLEFAGWLCRQGDRPGRGRLVESVVDKARKRLAERAATSASAAGPAYPWESVAAAKAAAVEAGPAQQALRKGWALRGQPSPQWAAAAGELASSAVTLKGDEATRLLGLAAVYRWNGGDAAGAVALARRAAGLSNGEWVRVAELLRWGLGNDLAAAAALLKLEDETRIRTESVGDSLGGLPALVFQADPESAADLSDTGLFRSTYGNTAAEVTAAAEGTGKVLRIADSDGDPADFVTRLRQYFGRETDYTAQVDFRLDGKPGPDARLGVFAHWAARDRNYRLDIGPGSIRFVKRRPLDPDERARTAEPLAEDHVGGGSSELGVSLKPGEWYTAKLRAEVVSAGDGRFVRLRAKVWPRWSREPADWMLTATDIGVRFDNGKRTGHPVVAAGRVGLLVERAEAAFGPLLVAANR